MSLKSIGLLECLALSRRQGVNAGQYSAVRPKCDNKVYGTKFKKKATSISLQPSSKERD